MQMVWLGASLPGSKLGKTFFLYIYNCQVASFLKFKIVLVFYASRGEFYIFHLYLVAFIWFPHSFLVSGDFCCLLITFANSLFPDQYRQNVGPDLDTDCLAKIF